MIKNKTETSNHTFFYIAVLLTLLMILYAQFVLGHYSQCFAVKGASNSLGLSYSYTTSEVMRFFEMRSKEALSCYSQFLKVWDTLFPVIYTAMYVSWIMYFFKRWQYWSIIPVLHMLADWTENFFEITLVNSYLDSGLVSDRLVYWGSFTTTTKWSLSFATYAILLFGAAVKVTHYISKKRLAYSAEKGE